MKGFIVNAIVVVVVAIGGFFLALWLILGIFTFIIAARAEERASCEPVNPESMIWTGAGYSIAQGDGHVFIARDDVHYPEVAAPVICLPARGLLKLYLQHTWPAFASGDAIGVVPAVHKNVPPYTWIDKHLNAKGERCCSDQDCEHLDPAGIEQRADGWFVKKYGETIPYTVAKPSEDGHFWICRWGYPVETKCFFVPYSGS